MGVKIVEFSPSDEDRANCVKILEAALEKARAGEIRDVAVVAAIMDQDGPQMWTRYWGQAQYAVLVAGVSALSFDLHWSRYQGED